MNTLDYLVTKYNIVFDENTKMPIEIPNVWRLDFIRWLRELDFRVGAEIGVAEGEFSKIICQNNPQIKLYGVDPWLNYSGYTDYQELDVLKNVHDEACRRMERYIKGRRFKMMKKTSMEGVKKFADNSLDFVYIDANHSEPYVTQDITEWVKKVKVGGIVAGHDYIRHRNYHVIEAVKKYTNDNHIRPWFVLGVKDKTPGIARDDYRSWMWVKQ